MINYMKSEIYRLLHKKGLHMTSVICLLLITAAAVVLYYSQKYDPNFPYGTSMFFYSNVIGGGMLILIVAFLFNLALTGKDMSLVKQSISFGISRNIIFWSKLILTLSYFLFVSAIGLVLMIVLGESFLSTEEQSIQNFLIACVNMFPIIISGFFMIHALKMLKVGEIYIIILMIFIFMFSGDLLRMLFQPITGLNELYKFSPDTLLYENLMIFMDYAAHVDFRNWVVGTIISVIFLLIGAKKFAHKNID